jgi:hypothetical protein
MTQTPVDKMAFSYLRLGALVAQWSSDRSGWLAEFCERLDLDAKCATMPPYYVIVHAEKSGMTPDDITRAFVDTVQEFGPHAGPTASPT